MQRTARRPRRTIPSYSTVPDLPPDIIINILARTAVSDIVHASAVSRAWRTGAAEAWRPLGVARWRHSSPAAAPPPHDAAPAAWAAWAWRRRACDAEALRCLRCMGGLAHAETPMRQLVRMGADAIDALARAAAWSDPRCLGLRHWAAVGLTAVAGDEALACMSDLMAKEAPQPEDMFEAGLLIVRVASSSLQCISLNCLLAWTSAVHIHAPHAPQLDASPL
jgi:hypothetical protein